MKIFKLLRQLFRTETAWEAYFKLGKEIGYEQTFKDYQAIRLQSTDELTKEEKDELLKFLIDRNLELNYHLHNNGFSVRKVSRLNERVKYYEN